MININITQLMTIFDYAKLAEAEKIMMIKRSALFLENYSDSDSTIYIYFLNNFFVEITEQNGKIIDNIPYKRGYKLDENSRKKTLYEKAA